MVEKPSAKAGDAGSIPGSERSLGEGNGNPPVFLPGESHGQRSLAGSVHGVAKSQTRLSTPHSHRWSKASFVTYVRNFCLSQSHKDFSLMLSS